MRVLLANLDKDRRDPRFFLFHATRHPPDLKLFRFALLRRAHFLARLGGLTDLFHSSPPYLLKKSVTDNPVLDLSIFSLTVFFIFQQER